jgi:hypothetical protein
MEKVDPDFIISKPRSAAFPHPGQFLPRQAAGGESKERS